MAALDLDSNPILSEIENSLKEFTYIIHSTYSHNINSPRYRLYVELDEDISDSYKDVISNISNMLGEVDKSSFSPNQIMYVPCFSNDYVLKLNINKPYKHIEKQIINKNNDPLQNSSPPLSIDVSKVLYSLDTNNLDYDGWLKVGMALHHQYEGKKKGLNKFIYWSSKHKIFNKEEHAHYCEQKYNSFSRDKTQVTFASIVNMVKYQCKKEREDKIQIGKEIDDKFDFDPYVNVKKYPPLNEEVFTHFHMNKGKKILLSEINNYVIMLTKYNINYTVDTKGVRYRNGVQTDFDTELSFMTTLSLVNKIPISNLRQSLVTIFKLNKEKNIFSYLIKNTRWDGISRLNEFLSTIEVEDCAKGLKDTYITKFLLQTLYINLIENPVKIPSHILVLEGKQRIGKTTWVSKLLPSNIKHLISLGAVLNLSDQTYMRNLLSNIVVELGEMEQSFKKTDINQFKAFFGRTTDTFNVKYEVDAQTSIRRTSFVGTINDRNFLKDITGSSRFLVLPVTAIKDHNIDMLQLYAELNETYDIEDFGLKKTETEMQLDLNEMFGQISPIYELFIDRFSTTETNLKVKLNATQTLIKLGYSPNQINKALTNEMASILRKFKFKYSGKTSKWELYLIESDQGLEGF